MGALEVVEALLRAGADASHRGALGRTAAEWAQERGHKQVVALLANPQLLREGDARRRGLADEALPAGTRLRVEPHGEGTYERWGKNRIGANDHFVRFASGVQKVQLKKLGAQAWQVVPAEPGLLAEPEPEPSPAAPGAADAAPEGVAGLAEAAEALSSHVALPSLTRLPISSSSRNARLAADCATRSP